MQLRRQTGRKMVSRQTDSYVWLEIFAAGRKITNVSKQALHAKMSVLFSQTMKNECKRIIRVVWKKIRRGMSAG